MDDERVLRVQLLVDIFKQVQAVRHETVGFEVVDILMSEGVHDSGNFIGILEADAFESVADATDAKERRDALQQLTEQGK